MDLAQATNQTNLNLAIESFSNPPFWLHIVLLYLLSLILDIYHMLIIRILMKLIANVPHPNCIILYWMYIINLNIMRRKILIFFFTIITIYFFKRVDHCLSQWKSKKFLALVVFENYGKLLINMLNFFIYVSQTFYLCNEFQ